MGFSRRGQNPMVSALFPHWVLMRLQHMDSGIAICSGKQALVAVLSKGEERSCCEMTGPTRSYLLSKLQEK